MKKNYNRLKWLAVVILAVLLYLFAEPVRAGGPLGSSNNSSQQEVQGVVTDTAGMPLPGVTVLVKGSNRGTTTDIDGKYTISVKPGDVLIFSFLGFKSLEEPVNGRREVWVELVEDVSSLGEVQINAGYYNTTKRESTGNISRVTAEEIELQPVISPLQALQGRMAGVEIIPGGNQPGMAPTIRIRGQNSLRSEGNLPLYIIDGVPINSAPVDSYSVLGATGIDPLNTLSLSNIASIEVLKDADATAIYGSRGANGVILITTKRGISGKTQIGARIYSGVAKVPNRLNLLNTSQYLQIRNLAFINDDIEPDQYNAYDLVVWDQNRDFDWQDFFFGGSSPVNDYSLQASGGNENTSFYLSGSYHKQGTVFLGDYDYNKITTGFNINHISDNKELTINLSVNFGLDKNNLVGYLDLTSEAFRLPPNAPEIFNDEGNFNWVDWSEVGLNNPLVGFYNSSLTEGRNLVSNLGISYQLFKGFIVKTNFGYTYFDGEEIVKRPRRSYNPSGYEGANHRSNHLLTNRNSWILEPQLTYSRSAGKGNIDLLLGTTFQESSNGDLGLQGAGYLSEDLIGNLSGAESIQVISDRTITYRYSAIFARVGFNWDKKYYINLTGRRDGSSRFGPGNRLSNFGAIGTAWLFSEESFVEDYLPFLSFGKLRGSYGTTGNDQIGDYGYLDAYESTIGPGGLYPTQLFNPNYSWEVNKKMEAALELGFLKDRINFEINWYRNRSSNQLVGYPLPATTGFNSVQANLPATVQNTGLEIGFSSKNIQSQHLQWQTSLNLTIPQNKLVSYPAIEQSSYVNTYRVGHPLNISLLYNYEGIDPETGFYKVTDLNGDGRLDYEDRSVVWNRGRRFFGGVNNNITYKNLSLQFLLEFVKQEGNLVLFDAGALNNQRADVIQALEGNDQFQNISNSLQASRAYSDVLDSTLPIVDASFVRLKALTLGYSIPVSLSQRIGLSSGKLFLNGQNLFTHTNYEGMDPESPYGGTQFTALRIITGGINLNF